VKDQKNLLAFYDFPAKHWAHIRTTNPFESSFATIRHRTDQTKGCVSRPTLLGLVHKLAMSAQRSWRRLRGFKLQGELIAGVKFVDGVRVQSRTHKNRNLQQAAA
jgi:transposase-like protein